MSDSNKGPGRVPRTVFISYSHEDVEDARELKRDLEKRGFTVWLDEERLKIGGDWESAIEQGLQASECVVLLMTPSAVRRRNPADLHSTDGYCLNEIAKAIQCEKAIIPVMLEMVESGPPTSVCRLLWVDMVGCRPLTQHTKKYEDRLEQLVQAVDSGAPLLGAEQSALFTLLAPQDSSLEFARHLGGYVGRRLIEKKVDLWLSSESSTRTLWVLGPMGVGKSAIAVNICHKRGDAFHKCARGNDEANSPRALIKTVAFQLAMHLPEYFNRLTAMGTDRLEAELRKSTTEIFDSLLLAPLCTRAFPNPERQIVIVIDGLDEATKDGRNEIAELIAVRAPRLPDWIRLIVTSREEKEIRNAMYHQTKIRIERSANWNLDDLRGWTKAALAEMNITPEDHLLDSIVRKSEGLFLYLTLVVQELRRGHLTPEDLPTLPAGLPGIFAIEFEQRFPDRDHYKRDIKPLLEIILAQRAPLPIEILKQCLKITSVELDSRIGALGTLLTVYNPEAGGTPTITPVHSSLREWIVAVPGQGIGFLAGDYAIDSAEGERLLARHGWDLYQSGKLRSSEYQRRYLPEHLAAMEERERLKAVLTDLSLLEDAISLDRRFEWIRLWRRFGPTFNPSALYLEQFEKLAAQDSPIDVQARIADAIGAFLRDMGFRRDALQFVERGLRLRTEGGTEGTMEIAASVEGLANLHRMEKQFSEALVLYQKALAIYVREVGARSAPVAAVYHELAQLHRDQDAYGDALAYNHRALRIWEHVTPPNMRALTECIDDMGVLLWEKKSPQRSEAYCARALALAERWLPPEDPITAECLHNLSLCHLGDLDKRDVAYLKRALAIFESTFVAHHAPVQICRRTLATHLESRGEYGLAEELRAAVCANSITEDGLQATPSKMDALLLERCKKRRAALAREVSTYGATIRRLGVPSTREGLAILTAIDDCDLEVNGPSRVPGADASLVEFDASTAPELIDALFQLGAYYDDYAYSANAMRLYDCALGLIGEPGNETGPLTERLLRRVSAVRTRFGNHVGAARDLRRQLAILERLGESRAREAVACCQRLASAEYKSGRYDAAVAECIRSIELVGRGGVGGEGGVASATEAVARMLNDWAIALKNERGDYLTSERYYRKALELNPADARFSGNLALLLTSSLSRHDEAEALYERALALNRTDAAILGNFAFFVQHVRNSALRADALYREAADLEPSEANNCCNHATLLLCAGERSEADKLLRIAWRSQSGEHDRISARILFTKAVYEHLEGRSPGFYWGQFRFLLEGGIRHAPWPATQLFKYIETAFSREDGELFMSMAGAIVEKPKLEQLLRSDAWQEAAFVPLDEGWPTE